LNTLELTDVAVKVSGRLVLNSFNLTANPGDVLFITGDNGSGKSTLLKSIARYLPLASGTIYLEGIPAADCSLSEWHRNIHYLPQHNPLAFPIHKGSVTDGFLP
jgi:iron complex transport system ATP-binding protein